METGQARYASGGFGGKGLDHIDKEREKFIQVQKRSFGEVDEEPAEDSASDNETTKRPAVPSHPLSTTPLAAIPEATSLPANASAGLRTGTAANEDVVAAVLVPTAAKTQSDPIHQHRPPAPAQVLSDIARKIAARVIESGVETKDTVAEINARFAKEPVAVLGEVFAVRDEHTQAIRGYRCELEINDYPQYARWKVTTRASVASEAEKPIAMTVDAHGNRRVLF